jgi:multidrug efflux pump subunit AcrB
MRRAVHAGRQTRTLTAAIRCGAFVAHFVPRAAGAHTKGRRARRFAATLTVSTALSTAVAVTAFAYWTAGGTGPSQAVAASLTARGPCRPVRPRVV